MAQRLPQYIVNMMADRAWRMEHYLWHEVRNGWLSFDEPTQIALRSLGWEPPRPARRPRSDGSDEAILDNESGEDFLYMHREMIAAVNTRLAGDPQYPRVQGWQKLPAPGDPEYPVPPAWDTGDADLNDYLNEVKSNAAFSLFVQWEEQFRDPDYLKTVSLGELGARLEFSIHNQMHMRWCERPVPGIRPDVSAADANAIDPRWDSPDYDWLGDTYSSHVNPVFWKLHGWVDDRINDWANANGVAGAIPWKGTWIGKMPGHAESHSFLSILVERRRPVSGHDHGNHLAELIQAIRLVASQGRFCRFYDKVILSE